MLVWNDLKPAEKIKIYDKGITVQKDKIPTKRQLMFSYRSGDMHAPRFDYTEALSLVAREFADCITENRSPITDAVSGLRVLQILAAAERSIKADGANVIIHHQNGN